MNATVGTAERSQARPVSLMGARLKTLAIVLVALGVVYVGIAAVMADRLTLADRKPLSHTPADFGLKSESVRFPSAIDGVRLEGWYLDSPGAQVIVMLHGKGGTRESGSVAMPVARALVQHNYDVLMFDFRGHGESEGNRMSLGELEVRDLAGALNYLKSRGVAQVGTLGYSMGAITELNAAPEHPEIRAIVADSPFAAAGPVLEAKLSKESGLPAFFNPGMIGMARVLYGMDFMNNMPERQVARMGNRPLLLIHGTADSSISVSHAYVLQKAAANNPSFQMWIVSGAEHTLAYEQNPEEYLKRVIGFFDQYLQ